MTGLLAWAGYQNLPDNPQDWPPGEKLRLITAMGFTPQGEDHQPDCPAAIAPGMYLCQCVAPATVWVQPPDVDVYRHETWSERLAARKSTAEP